MKEFRTLVGVTLEQLNALFGIGEELKELFKRKEQLRPGQFTGMIYYFEAVLPKGSPVAYDTKFDTRGMPEIFKIQKVQLVKEDLFVVKLKIEAEPWEVVWANTPGELDSQEKKRGTLLLRAAILLRIERALGTSGKVPPLVVMPY